MDPEEPTGPWPSPDELCVARVGAPRFESTLRPRPARFVGDDERVLLSASLAELERAREAALAPPSFEVAGPRRLLHFDPARVACGIVTCGGLCPGLNNVVRAIVLELSYAYGVSRVVGFPYGYTGLAKNGPHVPVELTRDVVDVLHEQGGTRLGTSRGPQEVSGMVDTLVENGIDILFVLGGDGGLRGAAAIAEEVARRGLEIAVVGVPKTIDNDLSWTWRSFGFSTAVEAARDVIRAAHTEARAAWNGIGLVKLMGRHSGFIAAHASVASNDVNFCLVPEVPFALEGENGFLAHLERRLHTKPHAVVVVAEGAGQDLLREDRAQSRDASGNLKLKDIGGHLRDRIGAHFAARSIEATIRYIDPSYIIRSLPANSIDSAYCLALGHHAVHAGMAGRTGVLVSSWNNRFVHVPIALAVDRRRTLDPEGHDWQRVLESTGQPARMG